MLHKHVWKRLYTIPEPRLFYSNKTPCSSTPTYKAFVLFPTIPTAKGPILPQQAFLKQTYSVFTNRKSLITHVKSTWPKGDKSIVLFQGTTRIQFSLIRPGIQTIVKSSNRLEPSERALVTM
ncbi:hypothetical protein CEXT_417591 [Caerostris extrusa]|uniref:Uncharacterized protein n=1 Tax=Caerostris extrusa TaxID=172846 RepID=A0AAV4R5Y3_CAEEX|nr:hypothetical protein CEXT_417591 [Caerostris extrusa]